MKGLIILIVVGIIALILVFQFGGYASLNPAEQAEAFREQVDRGMSWEEVADVREPREFVRLNPAARGGEDMPRDFDRDTIAEMIRDGDMSNGFTFKYRFDVEHHYNVVFDEQGAVASVTEPATAQDLYEGQLFTR